MPSQKSDVGHGDWRTLSPKVTSGLEVPGGILTFQVTAGVAPGRKAVGAAPSGANSVLTPGGRGAP